MISSSPSTVRRLLKARRAKPVTIFDNQDVTAPYTQYVFKLRSSSSPSTTREGWKLRKRYSDFHALHLKLRHSRGQWEPICLKQGQMFQQIVESLLKAAGPEFPRKHVRCDTSDIVHERRRQLMDYMRNLLAAYAELDVLLSSPGNLKGNFVDEIVSLNEVFVDIERFLEIPPKRKELEARLTRAVIALQDVETTPDDECSAAQCCICLADSNPSDAASTDGDKEMARLPCEHIFHEDCIIHWLQCSSTCPMCRRAVGNAASRRVAVG